MTKIILNKDIESQFQIPEILFSFFFFFDPKMTYASAKIRSCVLAHVSKMIHFIGSTELTS